MRKCKSLIILFSLFAVAATPGCIKKEAANAEADIIDIILEKKLLRSDPIITNTDIMVLGNKNYIDITRIAPQFVITPGAKISPASGTMLDFSSPQVYTVTSEDGKWKKEYTVRIVTSEIPTKYDFELWDETGRYSVMYENVLDQDGNVKEQHRIWSSGNGGYALVAGDYGPEVFPTTSTSDSRTGAKAAKLVTKKTGFNALPLAAGNLFLGSFISNIAMKNPMGATQFGIPFDKKPLRFTGYYKYARGKDFMNSKGNTDNSQQDACDIYAVLYNSEVNGETVYLQGDNILTDDRIVALARLKNPVISFVGELNNDPGNAERLATYEYNYFDLEFEYFKELDTEKLLDYKYFLSIVFTSSIKGAEFMGAPGSLLIVDDCEVICE